MADKPNAPRSVKFSDDERGGWSSDRPRPGGGRPREFDVTVRCEVLAPSDRLRYSPGSLLLIVSPSATERDRFTTRVLEEPRELFSLDKVRGMIQGRVDDDELDAKAQELLDAAVTKRLTNSETTVITLDGLSPDERARYVKMAAVLRRPRHLILLEAATESLEGQDKADLAELRRALIAGELGNHGFHTALRLSGALISEVKKVVFRSPPRDDD